MRDNNYVVIALKRDPRIMERFWSRVRKQDSENACWEWVGPCSKPGHPTFHVRQYTIPPAYISWYSSTDALPSGGRLLRLCGNSMCVRPSHLGWAIGKATEVRLLAEAEGYVSLAGVPRLLPDLGPRLPQVVRLVANE